MEALLASLEPILAPLLLFLPNLTQALLVLLLSLWGAGLASRGANRAMLRTKADPELALLISRVLKIALVTLGFVVALEQVDFDLTGFLTGLGIVGFTIGFALQDVSKNLVAGLLLLLQQPFDIGDAIDVGAGVSGVVTSINLRATTIRTFDGIEVHVPNTDLYTKVVRVFTADHFRRLDVTVLIASPKPGQASQVLLDTVRALPGVVHQAPRPRAMTQALDSGAKLLLWFWVDLAKADVIDVGDQAVRALHQALSEAGLEPKSVVLADPQPDVRGGARPRPRAR